jgi:hypothetical protein
MRLDRRGWPHILGVIAAAGLLLLLVAVPVAADGGGNIDLSGGCTLTLTIADSGGVQLPGASGPGTASQSTPVEIDPKGTVAWAATAPTITNATYHVSVYALPAMSGSFANEGGGSRAEGTVDLSTIGVLGQLTGLVYASGDVTGEGGTCTGAAWLRLPGNPITTAPGLVSLLLGGLGLLGVAWAVPGPHLLRGLGAGVLLGVGLGVLTILFGFVPFGQWTPYAAVAAGPVIGGILGFLKIGGAAAVVTA